jgi:hypothetical protein
LSIQNAGNFHSLGVSPDDRQVLFVSFYTVNTPYADEVLYLKRSLDQFSLKYFIEGLEGKGSWSANTLIKAYFLRNVLLKFSDYKSIVWLDADSIVVRRPDLFFELAECDFAVRGRGAFFSWKNFTSELVGLLVRWKSKHLRTLISMVRAGEELDRCHNCVMYFRNNPASLVIIDDWIEQIEKNNIGEDQTALQASLKEHQFYRNRFKILNLPENYAAKANWSKSKGRLAQDPVIIQNQVSEKYRWLPME